jgi:hypothetical protein
MKLSSVLTLFLVATCAQASLSFGEEPPKPAALKTTPLASAQNDAAAPQFLAEDKWEHAGYNSDEIVYSVFITNRDTRILRCTTRIQGFYFNNGKKSSIADQQLSTVFPQQQVQAGIWLDMDEKSGAKYQVKCKPA